MDDLRPLIDELELVSSGDEFYGERGGQPLILTYLNSSPPGIMFQVRLNTEEQKDLRIPESLSELSEQGDIKISCENGYGWLTIYDIYDYSVEQAVGLLDLFLQTLVDNQVSLDERCSVCRSDENAHIYYTAGKINRICDKCIELAEQKLIDKRKELGRRKYIYGILTPVAVVILALGWSLIWFAYDWCFSLSDTDTIEVNDTALFLFSAIAGVVIGLPAAFLLKKLCIQNHKLLSIISVVVVMTGCILGEIIYLTILIYRDFKVIAIRAAVESLKPFWETNSEGMVIMKAVIVLSAMVLIYLVAKAKKPEIEL